MHHISLFPFLVVFLARVFGPVGGLMFFGGKNHRANAPRINPRVFWRQKHNAIRVAGSSSAEGRRNNGRQDPDRLENTSNKSRSSDQNQKVRSDKINHHPQYRFLCREIRRKSPQSTPTPCLFLGRID
jgi:hypothetical protein